MSPASPQQGPEGISHAEGTAMTETEQNDELLATIKALNKARRDRADQRLREWGREREQIGFASVSIAEKMRLEREGAAHRNVAILGEGDLNQVESQSERLGRVLQIERFVRMMPREWIVVVVGCYVEHQTQSALAVLLGLDRNRVVSRIQDIQDRIMAEIEAQAIASMPHLTLHATAV